MRFCVLAASDSWYLKDLTRAAADRHEIVPITFRQLSASAQSMVGGGESVSSGTIQLADCDAVIARTMPPGSLEQVVFRMDALGRLESAGIPVINSARSLEAAVDKYLATARMAAAGLLVPRTIVCQTADVAMESFASLECDVVVKPLFGSEGRGITRLQDESLALRAFKMLEQLGAVIYLQQFIPHEGSDLRLLTIGSRVFGMQRRNHLDWRTNISRGATAEPLEVTDELAELALKAAQSVGAELAGVDLLPGQDGSLYAIEVNAVPGWKALAAVTGHDIARAVLDHVAARCRSSDR